VGGLYKVAEYALDHGADVELAGPDALPLLLAVHLGHVSIVDLLCQRGANVHTRFGPTNSLDEAVVKGDLNIVKTLIKHGADVHVRVDGRHGTAVMQAAVLGKCDIVQLLFEAGATFDTELQNETLAVCCSNLEDHKAFKVVKLLLPHCTTFADNHYELGKEILVRAVCKGKLQLAQLLHAAGAIAHTTDLSQDGMLIHCVYYSSIGQLGSCEIATDAWGRCTCSE
jgi:ankyrin repeat protein